MKRIVASVGLVAVGATGLHAASYAPGLTRMETSKPWSVSASLRGFYDDNYVTAPSGFEEESFGFEVSPTIALNMPMDQTFIGASYTYSLKFYTDRSDDPTDHQHEFLLKLNHKFSERYSVTFDDSFVYSQEPEVIDDSGAVTGPLRTGSDTLRNRARIRFRAEITEVFGLEPFYENTWYNYTDSGEGSRSALLDRFEHLLGVDGRYRVRRDLVTLVGYQYGIVSYDGGEAIADTTVFPGAPDSSFKDSTSHYFYVGADQSLSKKLTGSIRFGAQYTEYENRNASEWNPYADIRGSYEYLPGSFVQVGFRHQRNATEVATTDAASILNPTLDQESSTVYGTVSHKISPKLTGSLLGHFQHGSFNGGSVDGEVDNLFMLGANLEYEINRHWSAETGYNWDRLDSDLPFRSFSRNRVYVGITATY